MSDRPTLAELESGVPFSARHIGTDAAGQARMLAAVGHGSLDELCAAAVPGSIADRAPLRLPAATGQRAGGGPPALLLADGQ
ncbi:MAG TPA: hypothetical protein VE547_19740, partial [Mycobacteriales bacterium]|nr:hypothetical protein [Mycobacteriales bacterium]